MEVVGWAAMLLIGVLLGMLGGGGAILSVPMLVYVFGLGGALATAYSLFIVGATALLGSIPYVKAGQVSIRRAAAFAIPSILAVFIARRFALPALPEHLAGLDKDRFLVVLFAVVMIAAGARMVWGRVPSGARTVQVWSLMASGAAVGFISGLVGAGGGFLIVPALVILGGLEMKHAVGTSLLVIGVQSSVGFSGDVMAGTRMDWRFLFEAAALACGGAVLGFALARKVKGEHLRAGFGWFVLAMATLMLVKELAFRS